MLLELQISDFAIIDRLHLHLEHGFNVLTGETGAGKSIIIDALGTLRGEKTDATFVRAGSSRARIEGVFSLTDCPQVLPVLEEFGLLEVDDDAQVIITREISAESGRSVARVNGRAVNMSVLREVGGRLVDIHGQHEGIALFNTRTHLDMLDRYGELLPLRNEVGEQVDQLRQIRTELTGLRRSEAKRNERIEELRFLLEDVQAAAILPDEEEELARERSVLQNVTRITNLINDAYAMLYQGDESGRYPVKPVVESMATITGNLEELAKLDASVEMMASQASDLHYQLDDLATSMRTYIGQLDIDPARLDEIEDRLTVLRNLQRKYGGDLTQLLERAASAEAEIDRLSHSSEHIAALEQRETKLLVAMNKTVSALSQRRRATGDALAVVIEGAMGDLAMPKVRFFVSVDHEADPAGVALDDSEHGRVAVDRTGADRVEFQISPNPGEPLKPLAKIASGGESARLLLALKSILSRVDEVATMIFDEIDVGVGGRAGQVVGQKLWTITDAHQVVCITHLPQVAAFADAHYVISKEFSTDRTRTNITLLSDDERIDELAAMLDGTPVSEHSRGNAREIINRAATWKTQSRAQRDKTKKRSKDPAQSSGQQQTDLQTVSLNL